MIESLKIIFHSVGDKITDRIPELIGWSVATSLAIVFNLSLIEAVNGILQMIVLIISIIVGIATYIYTRRKTKKLDHGND